MKKIFKLFMNFFNYTAFMENKLIKLQLNKNVFKAEHFITDNPLIYKLLNSFLFSHSKEYVFKDISYIRIFDNCFQIIYDNHGSQVKDFLGSNYVLFFNFKSSSYFVNNQIIIDFKNKKAYSQGQIAQFTDDFINVIVLLSILIIKVPVYLSIIRPLLNAGHLNLVRLSDPFESYNIIDIGGLFPLTSDAKVELSLKIFESEIKTLKNNYFAKGNE